jgi:hypothetical protein
MPVALCGALVAGPQSGDTRQECDGSTALYTLPCAPSKARIYLDTTLQVLDTDYAITSEADQTITFVTKPTVAKTLYAYWDAYPEVKVKVGDFFKSTEGFHRVTSIESAQDITLDRYLSTGSETVTHYPAWQLDDGHGRTEIGINRLVEGVQLRLYVIPKYVDDAPPKTVKVTGISIGYIPQGRKILKATGS